jgi:hypothetical protein
MRIIDNQTSGGRVVVEALQVLIDLLWTGVRLPESQKGGSNTPSRNPIIAKSVYPIPQPTIVKALFECPPRAILPARITKWVFEYRILGARISKREFNDPTPAFDDRILPSIVKQDMCALPDPSHESELQNG